MTSREKWEAAGVAVALFLCTILGGSWLGAREDGIRMKATIDAQQQVIATSAKQSKDIQDAEVERDKVTAAKGGSFWNRFKRAAKYTVIGIAMGAAAVCGSGHCK